MRTLTNSSLDDWLRLLTDAKAMRTLTNSSLDDWLRLLSVTDFDDILLSSVLKLTLHEPNYKEKEVHRHIP